MKAKRMKRVGKEFVAMAAASVLAATTVGVGFTHTFADAATMGEALVGNYETLEEAQNAARKLNEKMSGEGSVLLKNKDNALPLAVETKVTVFGKAAQALKGASDNSKGDVKEEPGTARNDVMVALREYGFDVAEKVIKEADMAATTPPPVTNKDVAVVVLMREGGEGSDAAVRTGEEAKETENVGGWKHKNLVEKNDKTYKHYLMLTDAENEMIAYAKAQCGKVVVVLNTSNAMEMYNLQNDPEIDAIMCIGRPGTNGLPSLPKLLAGEINPSGKLVAEWYKDFTVDPTWFNSIANEQNPGGSNQYKYYDENGEATTVYYGIDYSEDIYIGYKYYETVYAEILEGRLTVDPATGEALVGQTSAEKADNWHAANVVYPFGYGLSYTNFDTTVNTIVASKGTTTGATLTLAAEDVSSSIGREAAVKTVDVTVTVTNKGNKAGKHVVQLYSSAPYTLGEIEKAAVNLVAYAKTGIIAPGKSETLTLTVNLQDMASYDYADANKNGFKGYELEAGTYSLYAADSSHVVKSTPKATLDLAGDATLALDDYSGNEILNLFSAENGRYYGLRKNDADWNGDGTVDANDKMFEVEQNLLSRADLRTSFPTGPIATEEGSNLAVTKLAKTLYDYYRGGNFQVSKYEYEHAAFDANKDYAIGDTFVLKAPSSKVYKASKASPAKNQLDMTSAYAKDSLIVSNNKIYKLKEALNAVTIKDNGEGTDGKATQAYAVGDVVQYLTTSWGRIRINTVTVTKAIAVGDSFATSGGSANAKTYTAASRIVTTGASANVTEINNEDYIKEFAAIDATIEQSGEYVYSDKLYSGTTGINGFNGHEDDLVDVAAEMLEGWSQMADAAAQLAAKEEAGESWILFNDLAGIRYNDTSVIKSGKLAGMTGEEAWLKFMNQWTWQDFKTACFSGGANGDAVPNLGIPSGGVADDPKDFQNGTYTWCDNNTIASTWNIELGYQEGRLVAQLGLLKNGGSLDKNELTNIKNIWLNPSINFQRTPFSGRNNEYYGQDGYNAGHLAQAVVRGIQSMGIGSHLKHMFLNDQETNRSGNGTLNAFVSEQAIREIYVKPFQMAIQEGGAVGAMSAFAAVGTIPTPSNYNMCIKLIQDEWGAEGFVLHPDMYNTNMGTIDMALRAGHNHISNNSLLSGTWDKDYLNPATGVKGGVKIGEVVKDGDVILQTPYYSNNQWYIVRLRGMQMMSEYAQTAHAKNGVIPEKWNSIAQTVVTGDKVVIDVSFKQAESTTQKVVYEISAGTLPEGLDFNASTGLITGTVGADVEAGEYKITVKAKLDGWMIYKQDHTVVVKAAADTQAPTVEINADGYWVINGTATTVKAQGPQGEPGETPTITINDDGFWVINGTATDVKAQGTDGAPGEQGPAGPQGPQGEAGKDGKDGASGGCNGSIATTVVSMSVLLLFVGAFIALRKKNTQK